MKYFDVIIVGGGAAGFFAAINIAELYPDLTVAILEKSKEVLSKVKVSGGGRCNVTHAEFNPQELVKNYPRGEKELLGPFYTFMTGDTMEWFEKRGVPLKIEDDGRIFPESNSSQTIINCFLYEAKKLGVEVIKQQVVTRFNKDEFWQVKTKTDQFSCEKLIIATGSSTKIWEQLERLGHSIVQPVPSLFTFNINDSRIKEIPGVVAQNVTVKVLETNLESYGPLLITHWGMSAPAILKLSAFGAVELAEKNYNFQIEINFINQDFKNVISELKQIKIDFAKKVVTNHPMFDLPKRLWNHLVIASGINQNMRWGDVNKSQLYHLSGQLTKAVFKVTGKSTFKEEFVTAGGTDLKEVNFKNYQSKLFDNLYFAGEVINVDAVTGGFNFQNAWTGAYILSKNLLR